MKWCCYINPAAGGGRGAELLRQMEQLSESKQLNAEISRLDRGTALIEMLRQPTDCDAVLVAGGDGSVSSAASCLCDSGIPLALLPLGTGNDLARELGVYDRFQQMPLLDLIRFYETKAKTRALTLWQASNTIGRSIIFCNYLSLGFDAAVVSEFAARRARGAFPLNKVSAFRNRLGYTYEALRQISYPVVKELQLQDQTGQQTFSTPACRSLMFANIKSVMGIACSNSYSDCFDQQLECIPVPSLYSYFGMILRQLNLTAKGHPPRSATRWRLASLNPEQRVQYDGEALGEWGSTDMIIELAGHTPILS